MPTFSTPRPVDLAINWQVGAIEIVASERADAVVTVTPTNPDKPADRRAAEEATVEFDGHRITVIGMKPKFSIVGPSESADLRVELPTNSRLTVELALGGLRTVGRLGATRIKASMGLVDIESTGDLWVRAGHGDARVGAVDGSLEITADHGQITIGSVTGDAIVKASHGSVQVGDSGMDLEAKLSYGGLDIARAAGSVSAKTSYGSIQLREVSGGSIDVESGFGAISVGVREGVPAWLDLSSKDGRVRNQLDGEAAPAESEQAVAIRARTRSADITIQRAR